MTRSQRRCHTYLWLGLGPLIATGFLTALAARPPVPIQSQKPNAAEHVDSAASAAKSPVGEGRP